MERLVLLLHVVKIVLLVLIPDGEGGHVGSWRGHSSLTSQGFVAGQRERGREKVNKGKGKAEEKEVPL